MDFARHAFGIMVVVLIVAVALDTAVACAIRKWRESAWRERQ